MNLFTSSKHLLTALSDARGLYHFLTLDTIKYSIWLRKASAPLFCVIYLVAMGETGQRRISN